VVKFDNDVKRISVTDPDVADVVVISPKELVINGKKTGATSLIFWAEEGSPIFYNLIVQQDADLFLEALNYIAPNEDISIIFNDTGAVLSGQVSSTNMKKKILDLAKAYQINLVDMSESPTKQVLLEVKVTEVSRNFSRELSSNFGIGDDATSIFSAIPVGDTFNQVTFQKTMQYLFGNSNSKISLRIKAAETKGDFKILAEPKLLVMDGEEGSFNVGNEIPIPSSMGTYGTVAYSFKQSGVILHFKPTILEKSGRVRLKLAPEISEIDESVGIITDMTSIPGFKTRKVETSVELNDGETLVIAGLLNNSLTKNKTQVPLLGDIPVLGFLFRDSDDNKKEGEVMIFITPHIVDSNYVKESI
jgi:pilus assembly protein CpaC